MAARIRRPRTVRVTIEELIEPDALVVATETFRPQALAALIQKGSYRRLNDPVVRANPTLFAVVLPVHELGREIWRDAA